MPRFRKAGATVTVAATFRPPQRALLMHYSFLVAKGTLDPSTAPVMPGVDIDWVHTDARGATDLPASLKAAADMVAAYEIVFAPALTSRHTEGNAIDMDIFWSGDLNIGNADGSSATIAAGPRTGANAALQTVGAGYGVHKLTTDPPHWSSDGH